MARGIELLIDYHCLPVLQPCHCVKTSVLGHVNIGVSQCYIDVRAQVLAEMFASAV